MIEYITDILAKIPTLHFNILLLAGLAIFGGAIGGRAFQKIKIPQVVGYIIIGVIIGRTGLVIVNADLVESMQPFNYFALGLIGFMVGGELNRDVFKKTGKQLIKILLCEGIAPFIFVTVLVFSFGLYYFESWKTSLGLALLFGAIASATDPASTTSVLKECRTRGPLTRTIFGIVALDDGLALLLFVIAASIAGNLMGTEHTSVIAAFIKPVYEIFGAVFLGVISGWVLSRILRKYSEKERLLAFSIGMVLLVIGIAIATHVSMLLAAMTLGAFMANCIPLKSKEVFKLVDAFMPPIYVLFFVLVGANLNLRNMTSISFIFVGIYLLGALGGKVIGSYLGASIAHAPSSVKKYLPFSLFSQAGIAIGLSILAAHYFPGTIGNTIVIVVTATTFISQIIGPPCIKIAMTRAGEVGLDVTEEDLILKTTVDEVMDKNPPIIHNNLAVNKILDFFSETDNLYYPVVSNDKKILGVITVDSIKNVFMASGVNDLLLAIDLMEPSVKPIKVGSSISSARKILVRYNSEYLPVVGEDQRLEGFIEKRSMDKWVSTKILELQQKAESLEET